jgi:hypothetical protein
LSRSGYSGKLQTLICSAKNRFEISRSSDFVAIVAKKQSMWMGLFIFFMKALQLLEEFFWRRESDASLLFKYFSFT